MFHFIMFEKMRISGIDEWELWQISLVVTPGYVVWKVIAYARKRSFALWTSFVVLILLLSCNLVGFFKMAAYGSV